MYMSLWNLATFQSTGNIRKFRTDQDNYLDSIGQIIGAILREPRRRAMAIARATALEAKRSQAVWRSLSQMSPCQAKALADDVEFDHLPQIAEYLNVTRRGVIFTGLHAGDYLLALLKLRNQLTTPRHIYVLRRKTASDLETRVFSHFDDSAIPIKVIRHGENRTLSVIRALRKGHFVTALFDLPQSFGKTTEVEFLDQQMQMVSGPSELAVLGHADIVPFTSNHSRGCSRAQFAPPIRATTVPETAQRLCDLGSNYIYQTPDQWQHWFHVPEMLGAASE